MKTTSSGSANPARVSRQGSPAVGGTKVDQGFEPRLGAYSTVGQAVLAAAAAAALGAAATASAQGTIHTITVASFDGSLSLNVPSGLGRSYLSNPGGFHNGQGYAHFLAAAHTTFGVAPHHITYRSVRVSQTHLPLNFGDPVPTVGPSFLAGAAIFFESVASGVALSGRGSLIPPPGGSAVGYFGVRFFNSAFTHAYLGWLRLKVTSDPDGLPTSISFTDQGPHATPGIVGAYVDAGDSIAVGQVSAIPEPASVAAGLALFALGAVGVREHRRRKQAAV